MSEGPEMTRMSCKSPTTPVTPWWEILRWQPLLGKPEAEPSSSLPHMALRSPGCRVLAPCLGFPQHAAPGARHSAVPRALQVLPGHGASLLYRTRTRNLPSEGEKCCLWVVVTSSTKVTNTAISLQTHGRNMGALSKCTSPVVPRGPFP